MDTKTLETLHQLAPDLMDKIMLRALVLEKISTLAPVGRRALAQRLRMPEREIRSICDALKEEGLISVATSGMMTTPKAASLLAGARSMTQQKSALGQLEQHIARSLNIGRVCIVAGNAEESRQVFKEAGRVSAEQLLRLLADGMVLTVSGGAMTAQTAQEMNCGTPLNVRVLPARGGSGKNVETQANTVAVEFARALGGSYLLLHLPDVVPMEALKELMRMEEVIQFLRGLHQTDVLFYGIGRASDMPSKRILSETEIHRLADSGAAGEAIGCCFDISGKAVYQTAGIGLTAEQLAQVRCVAAVALGAGKARAVLSVVRHHRHELLVIDESLAKALEKLL